MPNIMHWLKTNQKPLIFFSLTLILSSLTILAWFGPIRHHSFMGDDLWMMDRYGKGDFGVSFWSDFVDTTFAKFRPISFSLIGVLVRTFGSDFDRYVDFNLLLFLINALIFAGVVYRITHRWWLGAAAATLVLIIARYSYYAVFQVYGIQENLGMTFVILIMACVFLFFERAEVKWLWLANLFSLLAVYTHERFVVLAAPIFLLILINYKRIPRSSFLPLVLVTIAAPLSYIFVKQFVFQSPFLVGTGGSKIDNTFSYKSFLRFCFSGVLNMFGFNDGLALFNGQNFRDAGVLGYLLGVFVTLPLLVLFGIYLFPRVRSLKKHLPDLLNLVILAAFVGSLIASASVTIRQEYRWLYHPFAVFLLVVFYLLSKVTLDKTRLALALLVMVSFLSVDIYYRQFVDRLFFMDGLIVADKVKETVIDRYGADRLASSQVVLVMDSYQPIRTWYLGEQSFFKLYTGRNDLDIRYAYSLDQILPVKEKPSLVFWFDGRKGPQVVDISDDFERLADASLPKEPVLYNFVGSFGQGKILGPDHHWDTSTGTGIYPVSAIDEYGPRTTVNVTSSYQLLYPDLDCIPGTELIFRAAVPNSMKDGVTLFIRSESAGQEQELFNQTIPPSSTEEVLAYTDYAVKIDQCPSAKQNILFGAQTNTENEPDNWVSIKEAFLIQP